MKAVIFAYSRQGIKTADQLAGFFSSDDLKIFVSQRLTASSYFALPSPSGRFYGSIFNEADAMIFISSCGIAVREIAPFIRDKRTDPAVICIDELGKYVIPILSGHIGGANDLATKLAAYLDAKPIITTATDINHKFSVDSWAAKNEMLIDNMELAKEVSAAILERDIPLLCDLPIISAYPNGTYPGDGGPIGIYIGWTNKQPFNKTLQLIPQALYVGIGCRRGTGKEDIQKAVDTVFEQFRLDQRGIHSFASIDLKANEQGLLDYCEQTNMKIDFYSADKLQNVRGTSSHSDFVQKITGVDNVCERAALIKADDLIVPKTIVNSVTIAVGVKKWEVGLV